MLQELPCESWTPALYQVTEGFGCPLALTVNCALSPAMVMQSRNSCTNFGDSGAVNQKMQRINSNSAL